MVIVSDQQVSGPLESIIGQVKESRGFLTPVRRTTLTADICRKMVGHLLRGDWQEAQKLPPERELCLQLAVGRASLREALKALEIMGMIETRLGDGTYVCRRSDFLSRPLLWAITGTDVSDLSELVEARTLIESELSALAAERATAADLKAVGDCLGEMEGHVKDQALFQEADVAFHLAIAAAAKNAILANALQLMRNLMQEWVKKALQQDGVSQLALQQHREILLAIVKRNPEQARQTMRQHVTAMAIHLTAPSDASRTADMIS